MQNEVLKKYTEKITDPKYLKDITKLAKKFGEIFFEISNNVAIGNNTFIYGEAGTGKTEIAKEISLFLELDYEIINCSQWTSPIDIIGGYTPEGYVEGKLTRAFHEGKVIILDELPKIEPNTAGLLNEILSYKYNEANVPKITDKLGNEFLMHPNFRVIATGNTNMKEMDTKYSANYLQDLSLIDRFNGSFFKLKFNIKLAKELMQPYLALFEILNNIRMVLVEVGSNEIISLRTMLDFKRTAEYQEYIVNNYPKNKVFMNINKKFKILLENINDTEKETIMAELEKYGILNYINQFNTTEIEQVRLAKEMQVIRIEK